MRTWVVAIVLMCAVASVRADDKPWAVGVPAEKQRAALDLYKEGNGYFEQDLFKDAYARYEKAISLWDHPGIRYNAAICLINMDRPVEAYEQLIAAMQFGEAPLGPDLFKQGKSYEKALAGQVATLEVTCKEPDAELTLDGKPLLHAPGTVTKLVGVAGPHQIVATKRGYDTETRTITLPPGKKTITIELTRKGSTNRRINPWFVIGGGAVVGLASIPLWWLSNRNFSAYDANIEAHCPAGCMLVPDSALQLEHRAKLENVLAISAAALGTTGIAIGLTLRYLRHSAPATVTPVVGADRVGLALSGRW